MRHSPGLAFGSSEGHREFEVLGLVAQDAFNLLLNAQDTSGIGVFESIGLGIFGLSMNASNAELAVFAVDDGHNQLNVAVKIGNTSGGASNFLQVVLIHANVSVLRQRNRDVSHSTSRSSARISIGRASDGAQGGSGSGFAISHFTIANLLQRKGLSRARAAVIDVLVGLMNGNSLLIGIIRSSRSVSRLSILSHRDGGHAQQHHDCQQHCQNLLHGFILLKIEFVILWNRPGAARRRYSLGFWGHRPGPGFTGPFCAGW